MGILRDLIRPTPSAAVQQRHESGRSHTNGYLTYDEINAVLTGQGGIRVYDKMFKTDPEVRKALIMLWATIAAATYEIAPAGEDDDSTSDEDRLVADFIEWVLFDHMRPKLSGHLWEVGRVGGRTGFVPFELIYDRTTWKRTKPRPKAEVTVDPDDPLQVDVEDRPEPEFEEREVIAIEALDLRLPKSIYRWVQEGHKLTQLEQFTVDGTVLHEMRDILYYRFGSEGDNWEGESLLRSAYKHWKYKEVLEMIDSIRHERFSIGVPIAYPPSEQVGDKRDEIVEMLKGIRANEQAYILAPGPKAGEGAEPGEGWVFDILQPESGGQGDSILDSLKYHKDAIAAAVIAEFMRLGQENVGARATADVQQDPFYTFAESIADSVVVDAINEQLIPRLVGLNFETDRMPRLKLSLIDAQTLEQLASFVNSLASIITIDDDLEDHLREQANLPPADPAIRARKRALADQTAKATLEAARNPESAAEPGAQPAGRGKPSPGPGGPGKPGAKKTLSADAAMAGDPDDPLSDFHRHMQLGQLERALDGAKESMAAAVRPFAVEAAAIAAKGGQATVTPEMTAAIANEVGALRAKGFESVQAELHSQGAVVTVGALAALGAIGEESDSDLAHAAIIAAAIVAAINLDVGQASIALDDEATLQEVAESSALRVARTAGTDGGPSLVAAGRVAAEIEYQGMILGAVYTGVLDRNACRDCLDAIDGVVRPLDDPIRVRRKPPNPACRGRGRCRCLEFYVFDAGG